MTVRAGDGAPEETLGEFCEAVAEDLLGFAVLHGREPTVQLIADLRRAAFPDGLALRLSSARRREAATLMSQAIEALPDPLDDEQLDGLSVAFADIYLTHRCRASPYESVWLDKDNLERQEPMFRVRAYYQRHGLQSENWRERADDHVVLQLQFVAHLLKNADDEARLREVAQFLDEHLLRWIGGFAVTVAANCGSSFFVGLALLTAAYVEELRDLLALLLDEPRPAPKPERPDPPKDWPEPDQQTALTPLPGHG